jgi:tRNA G18 (ribose-2'-O)-methylase SpoU
MGAALRVPFARERCWPNGLEALRAAGFTLVALTPRASRDLDQLADERPERLAWIVGSEGSGLSPEVEAMADRAVRISMREGVDSLNLAVATGIALSRTTRLVQR